MGRPEERRRTRGQIGGRAEPLEDKVGAVEDRTETLEGFKDRSQGFAASSHGDGAHSETYSKPGHEHPGKANDPHGDGAHSETYSKPGHEHPGKADNPHGNGQHTTNYATADHNHSQSVKLMSVKRRTAAVELRNRIRRSPTSQDLADGLLFVMALLFDDAGEALDKTLGRSADEQMALHIAASAGVEVPDTDEVEPAPEGPHPDLDRITGK